jgi:hypothetical protein
MVLKLIMAALLVLSQPASAIEWNTYEGPARGFPTLRDQSGKKIADGEFVQWNQNGRLHVRITYSAKGQRIEETAVFRQRPELVQEAWALRELRNGKLYRHFTVDFKAGKATAQKLEEGELKEWSDDFEAVAGQSFAGFGFTLAIRALHDQLVRGAQPQLQTVGFTPKPRAATVELQYAGVDRVRISGRTLRSERFIVHPKIPWIAKPFISVPDAQIWLTSPAPAAFLRWEGPLAEPDDPITRVDGLPGGPSGPAVPVATSGRRD